MKKNKHKISEVLLFKLSKGKYREVRKYMQQSMEVYGERQNERKYTLMDALIDHLFGRKYYCVLLSRPTLRVRYKKRIMHPYETSSDIFFSEEEAWEYYEKMHDESIKATFNSHQIICFRSKEPIPVWNMHSHTKGELY